jgi:predicted metal-dependent phosphoesterase TrpH
MLIDLHTHTLPRSDDSELAPDEMIAHAKSAGLDAICFTEHDVFWKDDDIAALCRKHEFLVLPGVEINTEVEHLLVFGLKKWIIGMTRAAFVRKLVDEVGGVMIVAHPFRRKILRGDQDPENNRYYRELNRACENPLYGMVEAIEVFNARGSSRENAFSGELAERSKLPGIGGSDAHEAKEIGRIATFFEREVTTLLELIAELKAGRFRVAYPDEIRANLNHQDAKR